MDLRNKTIAFDFDGTITKKNEYPYVGEFRENIKTCIDMLLADGATIFIWTCREQHGNPEQLEAFNLMVAALKRNSIYVHGINTNPVQDFKSTKLCADLYVDDNSLGWEPNINGIQLYDKITEFFENKDM